MFTSINQYNRYINLAIYYGLTCGSESSAESAFPGILSTIAPSRAVSCRLFSPSSMGALPIDGLLDGLSLFPVPVTVPP